MTAESTPISVPLERAIAEYKKSPFSPEAVTNYWRAKLQADGKRIGLNISVPDCDWTKGKIRKPMIDVKGNEVPSMMVYIPEELTGTEGLVKLGQMYPKMNNRFVQEGTTVQDSPDANKRGGWIKVEATIDTPNLNTTQKELEDHARSKKYSSQRLNVYILASQASKDSTGRYLGEEATATRPHLGSRDGNDAVYPSFHSDGRLYVGWNLYPQSHTVYIGGRFEEAKKA